MIVDTSALIAVLRDESDAEGYARALASSQSARISAANYLEAAIVIDANRDPVFSRRLEDVLRTFAISVEPVTHDHAEIARQAYRDFGRG
ncbi:MAG: type II toxin-antitoxin system VapC family toxin, partial [Candidatus Dormibacteraeota bacterium]|nr:type II toxin-antitoxin system VapC family toxin [Candidatus Dormibacteraeota bacterium]